jgi:hypothetical protein
VSGPIRDVTVVQYDDAFCVTVTPPGRLDLNFQRSSFISNHHTVAPRNRSSFIELCLNDLNVRCGYERSDRVCKIIIIIWARATLQEPSPEHPQSKDENRLTLLGPVARGRLFGKSGIMRGAGRAASAASLHRDFAGVV